nr:2973_t:CDS:2 [Entrophospora candida]
MNSINQLTPEERQAKKEELRKNLDLQKELLKEIEEEDLQKEKEKKKTLIAKKETELKNINQQIINLRITRENLAKEIENLKIEIGEKTISGKIIEEILKEEARAENSQKRNISPGDKWSQEWGRKNNFEENYYKRNKNEEFGVKERLGKREERVGNFGCSNCKETTHLFKDCPEIECGNCQRKGHIKKFCPGYYPEENKQEYNIKEILVARKEAEQNHETEKIEKIEVELPNEIIKEIFLQTIESIRNEKETLEKHKNKRILDLRRISKGWTGFFTRESFQEIFMTRICKPRNKFKKKQPCTCGIDAFGHLKETCRNCIEKMKYITEKEKILKKAFGKELFNNCDCEFCKERRDFEKRKEDPKNKKAEIYGKIFNQIEQKQTGYYQWTRKDIIGNIQYHKTTNAHKKGCRTCQTLKERLDEIRELENNRNFQDY